MTSALGIFSFKTTHMTKTPLLFDEDIYAIAVRFSTPSTPPSLHHQASPRNLGRRNTSQGLRLKSKFKRRLVPDRCRVVVKINDRSGRPRELTIRDVRHWMGFSWEPRRCKVCCALDRLRLHFARPRSGDKIRMLTTVRHGDDGVGSSRVGLRFCCLALWGKWYILEVGTPLFC